MDLIQVSKSLKSEGHPVPKHTPPGRGGFVRAGLPEGALCEGAGGEVSKGEPATFQILSQGETVFASIVGHDDPSSWTRSCRERLPPLALAKSFPQNRII